MINEVLAWIAQFSIEVISSIGYAGIAFLMILESMIFPMPSELVMPFAGFLAFKGELNFLFVVIASIIGSIIGSLISYYAGMYLGVPIIKKYGKYLLLNERELRWTESWFERGGEKTILISRFIPVVRHFISIPAGVARMNISKFLIYTIMGAGIWNAFLAWMGYILGANWQIIRNYSEYISFSVDGLIILGIIYFVYNHLRNR